MSTDSYCKGAGAGAYTEIGLPAARSGLPASHPPRSIAGPAAVPVRSPDCCTPRTRHQRFVQSDSAGVGDKTSLAGDRGWISVRMEAISWF